MFVSWSNDSVLTVKNFYPPQQSLERLKNASKPKEEVSPLMVHIWSPHLKSGRIKENKNNGLQLCIFVNLPWLPIVQLRAWTSLLRYQVNENVHIWYMGICFPFFFRDIQSNNLTELNDELFSNLVNLVFL